MPKDLSARAGERKARPKGVIFDIGRVIVGLNLNRAFAPIAAGMRDRDASAPRLSPQDVWKIVRGDELWQDWQEGRISPAEWHQHLMRRLKLSLTYAQFRDAWNLVLDPETLLSEELFAHLGARCRLALLSNTDPIHVQALEERFTFGRHFPVRIYSCSVGASKPSAVIYRAALEQLGLSASESLYVDDIQEFVDAAQSLGLDAIRFESRSALENDLRLRDLL